VSDLNAGVAGVSRLAGDAQSGLPSVMGGLVRGLYEADVRNRGKSGAKLRGSQRSLRHHYRDLRRFSAKDEAMAFADIARQRQHLLR
jgi:hypothetical protein